MVGRVCSFADEAVMFVDPFSPFRCLMVGGCGQEETLMIMKLLKELQQFEMTDRNVTFQSRCPRRVYFFYFFFGFDGF